MFKKKDTPPRLHKQEETSNKIKKYIPFIIRVLIFALIMILLLKLCFMYVPPTYGYFSH